MGIQTSKLETATGEQPNARCAWCTKPFVRVRTIAYCDVSCRKAATKHRLRQRYEEEYTFVEQVDTGTAYEDYKDNSKAILKKYGNKVKINHNPKKQPPITVPTLDFKRFKEDKNIIVFELKRDKQRESWRE